MVRCGGKKLADGGEFVVVIKGTGKPFERHVGDEGGEWLCSRHVEGVGGEGKSH